MYPTRFFFKENVTYLIWIFRDAIYLILGTRFSLILGTQWLFSLILGTRFSILGTRIGSLKHLKKNCIRQWCMGEFEVKTTVNVYRNKIYVCIKSSKIPDSLDHATLVIKLNGIIRKINQIKRLISVVTNEKKEQVATKYMVNQITCWNSQW